MESNNQGFTIKCNKCGREVVVDGAKNQTVGEFSYSNNELDIAMFNTGTYLYGAIRCDCENEIRGELWI